MASIRNYRCWLIQVSNPPNRTCHRKYSTHIRWLYYQTHVLLSLYYRQVSSQYLRTYFHPKCKQQLTKQQWNSMWAFKKKKCKILIRPLTSADLFFFTIIGCNARVLLIMTKKKIVSMWFLFVEFFWSALLIPGFF